MGVELPARREPAPGALGRRSIPSVTDERELIRRRLCSLERDELVERLLALAERDDALRLALVAESQAASGELDVRGLRKQLTSQLRVTDRSYDWRYARRYAGHVSEALDLLAALLDAGRAAEVVELAEHCMKRLDTAGRTIDDSGGYVRVEVDRLKEIHHASCLRASIDTRKLALRLADWALTSDSDWEWFLDAPTRYADVLGDDGLAAFRERIEPEWQQLPALPATRDRFGFRYEPGRFRVTFLREELARAGGSADELVDVLAQDLSSPRQFARIADALEEAGREREAVAWLERGNAVHLPAGDPTLRARIVAAYLRDGQVDDAVALAERAHAHAPSVTTYVELRAAAEAQGGWAGLRPSALERLRDADRFGGRSAAVRAQLADGDLAGAWADAREGGCDDGAWLELADASRESQPDGAVGVYRRLVEDELEHAGDSHYKRVVDLLRRWRATLEQHGRAGELAQDVSRIRERYKRRTRLLTRLDRAGL